jgi:hypothetical protein
VKPSLKRGFERLIGAGLKTLVVISVFLVPVGFVQSGSGLTRVLDSVLRLRVDPRFSGGTELRRFYDPEGDDSGAGSLVRPKGEFYSGVGALDLLKYVVYEPELDAAWSSPRQFWQLAVTLSSFADAGKAPLGFSAASIRIYVSTGGPGSTETAVPRAELVGFDPAWPWDVMVEIDGWHETALLRTADGRLSRRIPLISVPERKTVYVRLPLDIPETKRILDGRATRHYVIVCGYDPLASGLVLPVKEEASSSAGGGASSSLTPRVWDVLAPSAVEQARQLSSFDEAGFRYAVLEPVVAERGNPGIDLAALGEKARVEGVSDEAARRSEALKKASDLDPIVSGTALFVLGEYGRAGERFAEVLAREAGNPVALAYSGSILAMKGGKASSPLDAVRFVNEGFALLDRAVAAAKTDFEVETARMNRASVGAAVPEAVFGKSAAAGVDFRDAAAIAETRGDGRAAGDRLVASGEAFERAGNEGEAESSFLGAAALGDLSAAARLALASRGYPLAAGR